MVPSVQAGLAVVALLAVAGLPMVGGTITSDANVVWVSQSAAGSTDCYTVCSTFGLSNIEAGETLAVSGRVNYIRNSVCAYPWLGGLAVGRADNVYCDVGGAGHFNTGFSCGCVPRNQILTTNPPYASPSPWYVWSSTGGACPAGTTKVSRVLGGEPCRIQTPNTVYIGYVSSGACQYRVVNVNGNGAPYQSLCVRSLFKHALTQG